MTVGTATGMVDAKAAPDPGDWLARRASGSLLAVDETLTYPVNRAVKLADVASASAPLMVATMFSCTLVNPGVVIVFKATLQPSPGQRPQVPFAGVGGGGGGG